MGRRVVADDGRRAGDEQRVGGGQVERAGRARTGRGERARQPAFPAQGAVQRVDRGDDGGGAVGRDGGRVRRTAVPVRGELAQRLGREPVVPALPAGGAVQGGDHAVRRGQQNRPAHEADLGVVPAQVLAPAHRALPRGRRVQRLQPLAVRRPYVEQPAGEHRRTGRNVALADRPARPPPRHRAVLPVHPRGLQPALDAEQRGSAVRTERHLGRVARGPPHELGVPRAEGRGGAVGGAAGGVRLQGRRVLGAQEPYAREDARPGEHGGHGGPGGPAAAARYGGGFRGRGIPLRGLGGMRRLALCVPSGLRFRFRFCFRFRRCRGRYRFSFRPSGPYVRVRRRGVSGPGAGRSGPGRCGDDPRGLPLRRHPCLLGSGPAREHAAVGLHGPLGVQHPHQHVRSRPVGRPLRQTRTDQGRQVLRNTRQIRLVVHHLVRDDVRALRVERPPPGRRVHQHGPQREHVRRRPHLARPLELLGRHERRRTDQLAGLGPHLAVRRTRDTEVDDLGPVGGEQHVAGLEVAVHHAGPVDVAQRLGQPRGQPADLVGSQRAGAFHLVTEGRPGNVEGGHPGPFGVRVGVHDRRGERAAHPPRRRHLLPEPAAELGVLGELGVHHLHRQAQPRRRPRQVHHTHPARAQACVQAVPARVQRTFRFRVRSGTAQRRHLPTPVSMGRGRDARSLVDGAYGPGEAC